MRSCLEFQNVSKRYGRIAALTDISLELEQGSTLALLGPNGAGKSTLFGCLLGFTHPSSGEIRWQGEPVTPATRRRFGYTPERVALYWQQTVWDNAVFFARLRGHGPEQVEEQLIRVGLHFARERKAHQLSKGMLQRLALAIALCGQPELLVLDEPFNGLDPALLDRLSQILQDEQKRGATLLISTHTISAVEPLATHTAVLLNGQLAAFGSTDELREAHRPDVSLEEIYRSIASEQHRVPEEVF